MPTRDPSPELDDLAAVSHEEVSRDRVTFQVAVSPALHQPYGIVHGGVYAALAERAAVLGATAWLGGAGRPRATAVGTQFLRAVRDGTLFVEAHPVHRGRGQQLWQVRITGHTGPAHDAVKVVATAEVRLFNAPAD